MTQTQSNQEARAGTRVTLIGMLLDAVLGLFKCVVGLIFHSQALIVDGIHSFSDVASDLLVLALMRTARQAPDSDHPYGHQRFETLGTMILGSLLLGLAGALAWDNLQTLLPGTTVLPLPEWPVLVVAAFSVVSKEWIYRYTRRVGEAIRSDLIVANAWHSRTDALSSIIVFIAVAGAMTGVDWLDTVAAIAVAIVIGHIGWTLTWRSVRELVDTALDPETTRNISQIARETEGVRDVHDLRSRRMGSDILLDLHLLVSPVISVSEGHEIGVHVTQRIREAYPDIREVTFHIDAEDDAGNEPSAIQLPTRRETIQSLETAWRDHLEPETLRSLRLHYLGRHVSVEVYVHNPDNLGQPVTPGRLKQAATHLSWLGDVRVWVPSTKRHGSQGEE
ncbi:cation diffusion facilitator family transporter [Marinobacter sp. JSM 1782161]|uniref:cation diffusion facilitator family transporter n=1 Tax=Marinobacter sp. JSM 1782161 TaxID=2685906 RepID=UPI0014037A70|nr:cation diffusion facilitator family transporter [Marinobacter sp. JSM 1782161]